MTPLRLALPAALCAGAALMAQKDAAVALKADNFYLEVANPIIAPGLETRTTVRIRLDAEINADGDVNFEQNVPATNSMAFQENFDVAGWRILDPGNAGTLTPLDNGSAVYRAPSVKPPGGLVTVSVDLIPRRSNQPKASLLGRITITEDDTVFVLDVPSRGVAERYVMGATANPALDRAMNAPLTPEMRAMVQAQMQAAQAKQGVDVATMMSKARAIYSAHDDATAILIQIPRLASDGRSSDGEGAISLTFKGRSAGRFTPLMEDTANKQSIGVVRPNQEGYVGGHAVIYKDGGSLLMKLNCPSCVITIDKYDDKIVKGSVNTEVDLFVGEQVIRGRLSGRFTVPLATAGK